MDTPQEQVVNHHHQLRRTKVPAFLRSHRTQLPVTVLFLVQLFPPQESFSREPPKHKLVQHDPNTENISLLTVPSVVDLLRRRIRYRPPPLVVILPYQLPLVPTVRLPEVYQPRQQITTSRTLHDL